MKSAPINFPMPDSPHDKNYAKEFLKKAQMCEVVTKAFKEESNGSGKKSLTPIDELGNTILHISASENDPDKPAELIFYSILNGLKNKNPRNNEG